MENLYSCRKCALFSLCVWFVVLSTEAVTNVQISFDFEKGSTKYKTFDYKLSLELKCNTSVSQDEKTTFSWLKDGQPLTVVEPNSIRVNKDSSTLTVKEAEEKHSGEYSCVVVKNSLSETVNVTAVLKPVVGIQSKDTSVVEGEKLIIICNARGTPIPKITWRIGGENSTFYNQTDARVNILDYADKEKADSPVLPNGMLQINEASMDDRNTYTCFGTSTVGGKTFNSSTQTFVRVKDKMAALWPFLGICLEVVVLCTVILIYEKKRNKTEMDESDTDASPEQKNTPDHGKDSDVRHRK